MDVCGFVGEMGGTVEAEGGEKGAERGGGEGVDV